MPPALLKSGTKTDVPGPNRVLFRPLSGVPTWRSICLAGFRVTNTHTVACSCRGPWRDLFKKLNSLFAVLRIKSIYHAGSLVFDLSITHDRFGSSTHVHQNGLLSHPQDLDAPLRLAAQRKLAMAAGAKVTGASGTTMHMLAGLYAGSKVAALREVH
jgi:hypothetical protein